MYSYAAGVYSGEATTFVSGQKLLFKESNIQTAGKAHALSRLLSASHSSSSLG